MERAQFARNSRIESASEIASITRRMSYARRRFSGTIEPMSRSAGRLFAVVEIDEVVQEVATRSVDGGPFIGDHQVDVADFLVLADRAQLLAAGATSHQRAVRGDDEVAEQGDGGVSRHRQTRQYRDRRHPAGELRHTIEQSEAPAGPADRSVSGVGGGRRASARARRKSRRTATAARRRGRVASRSFAGSGRSGSPGARSGHTRPPGSVATRSWLRRLRARPPVPARARPERPPPACRTPRTNLGRRAARSAREP